MLTLLIILAIIVLALFALNMKVSWPFAALIIILFITWNYEGWQQPQPIPKPSTTSATKPTATAQTKQPIKIVQPVQPHISEDGTWSGEFILGQPVPSN